nr:ribonuclease H-like domain-containing protein [Tanacetum cinerariifolium]
MTLDIAHDTHDLLVKLFGQLGVSNFMSHNKAATTCASPIPYTYLYPSLKVNPLVGQPGFSLFVNTISPYLHGFHYQPFGPPGFPSVAGPPGIVSVANYPNGQPNSFVGQTQASGTVHSQHGQKGSNTIPGHDAISPHAFSVMTPQNSINGAWNFDIGASSHLNNSINSLSKKFNTCMYPSVSVGDDHSILVTNTGHSILPTPFKSLHLNNVLITPHIVKNLIYVRQFVRDNNCTIEFDAFDFSVKDFMTRQVLLRCDSMGDLYPVTTPSLIPHVFLEKPPVLCHACQLGKHVRLSFVNSNTVVTSCFDIIHSDVWTSPIPSLSGFKYYVLFFDHYSQFVWVYPLLNKYDVLSKFVLFRTYVRTQFKCEIRSFQCDHGDNDTHDDWKLVPNRLKVWLVVQACGWCEGEGNINTQ